MRLLVIIPAYNEADNLPSVVREIEGYEYIIINDGSTDYTKILPYNMINLTYNHGVGYAMRKGYEYAYENGYTHAIQIDGDCQHNPAYIKDFIEAIKNADMVIGSRFANEVYKEEYKKENGCKLRCLGIKHIRKLIYKKTGKIISDPTSGMRLVNRDVMKYFLTNYPLKASEPISVADILSKGMIVKEIPVKMRPRKSGSSFVNLRSAWDYMREVQKRIKKEDYH